MEIQVQLEDLSSVKKRLRVEIPAENASREFDRVAEEYRDHARLPGFRPGKAPVGLVKRHYIKDIRDQVVRSLLPKAYEQALQEVALKPLTEPDVEPVDFKEGTPLTFVAEFEVRPKIELDGYLDLEVQVEATGDVNEEEVDEQLQRLRESHATLEAVEDRPVQDGDHVVIDLVGERLDGSGEEETPVPAIQEEGITIEVGDEHTLAAFSEALRGMNIAEEKQFEVEYPEDYPEAKLAGAKLRMTAEVTDIKCKRLPDLGDEFAKDVGDYEGLEALKDSIREHLGKRNESRRSSDIKTKLVEKLIQKTSFEVPEALVQEQVDHRLRDLARNLASRGTDPFRANLDWAKLREDLRGDAEKSARADLILQEVVRLEHIEAEEKDKDLELETIAASMGQPIEKIRQHFQREGRMEGLAAEIRRRKALDLLVANARVL